MNQMLNIGDMFIQSMKDKRVFFVTLINQFGNVTAEHNHTTIYNINPEKLIRVYNFDLERMGLQLPTKIPALERNIGHLFDNVRDNDDWWPVKNHSILDELNPYMEIDG